MKAKKGQEIDESPHIAVYSNYARDLIKAFYSNMRLKYSIWFKVIYCKFFFIVMFFMTMSVLSMGGKMALSGYFILRRP
jgi:hypothetical protein